MSIRLSTVYAGLALAVAMLTLALVALPAHATHAWNGYHWARTANPFALELGDNVDATYDANLATASADWSTSSVLDTAVVPGNTDGQTCAMTSGMAEVCNADYGATPWAGLATILVDANGHIYAGKAQMNDHYLLSGKERGPAKYAADAYQQFVTCQEIAHTFGLDHQDEIFSNKNLGTCMDYTSDPDGGRKYGPSNEHPNQHDYDQLELIYAHLDSYTTLGGSFAPVHQIDATDPGERGHLVAENAAEKVFVRNFDDGTQAVTVITLVQAEEG